MTSSQASGIIGIESWEFIRYYSFVVKLLFPSYAHLCFVVNKLCLFFVNNVITLTLHRALFHHRKCLIFIFYQRRRTDESFIGTFSPFGARKKNSTKITYTLIIISIPAMFGQVKLNDPLFR